MRPVEGWLSVIGSVLAVAAAAVGCWWETSIVAWITNLGVLAILLLVTVVYDRPGRHLLRSPFAQVYPLCAALGVASVVRIGDIGWPHVTSTAMGGVVVMVVVLAYVLWGLREPGSGEVRARLVFPLRTGRWVVAVGGVAALNHHLASGAQAGAVDLVALRPDGARAAGICPSALTAYESYGKEVASPCDGIVVSVVDGEPEQLSHRGVAESDGNHVNIDNGSEVLHLSHLRPGSVRVAVGDGVVAGQPLAEVGSSGSAIEPHLHLHAERGGAGLKLRFSDVPSGRLRPGLVIEVAWRVHFAPDRRD